MNCSSCRLPPDPSPSSATKVVNCISWTAAVLLILVKLFVRWIIIANVNILITHANFEGFEFEFDHWKCQLTLQKREKTFERSLSNLLGRRMLGEKNPIVAWKVHEFGAKNMISLSVTDHIVVKEVKNMCYTCFFISSVLDVFFFFGRWLQRNNLWDCNICFSITWCCQLVWSKCQTVFLRNKTKLRIGWQHWNRINNNNIKNKLPKRSKTIWPLISVDNIDFFSYYTQGRIFAATLAMPILRTSSNYGITEVSDIFLVN